MSVQYCIDVAAVVEINSIQSIQYFEYTCCIFLLSLSTTLQHIGLYRENAIAIESEARDPFGGNVYYLTMQITFRIPEFARKELNLHCDVVHVSVLPRFSKGQGAI